MPEEKRPLSRTGGKAVRSVKERTVVHVERHITPHVPPVAVAPPHAVEPVPVSRHGTVAVAAANPAAAPARTALPPRLVIVEHSTRGPHTWCTCPRTGRVD
eukprot:gene4317-biopygen21937